MNIKKNAARGIKWSVFANGFNQSFNFVIYIVLARLLEVEEFGLVAFSFLFIEFSRVFQSVGINQKLIQLKTWSQNFASTAFWLIMIVSFFLTLILLVLVAPLTYLFYSEKAALIILSISIFPLLSGSVQAHNAKLQREFRYKAIAIIDAISVVIGGVISIVLALDGFGVWALVIGRLIQSITSCIFVWHSSSFMPSLILDKKDLTEIKVFGLPILYASFVGFFAQKSINIVGAFMLGPAVFALLAVGRRPLVVLQDLIMKQFNKVFYAAVSRIDDAELSTTYYRVIALTAFIFLPIYMGLGAVSPVFIGMALGDKWNESVNLMIILSLIGPALVIGWYLNSLLTKVGKTKATFQITKITCLTNLSFAFVSSFWGVEAMCISAVLALYISLPFRFRIAARHLDLSLKKAIYTIYPYLLAVFLMFIVVLKCSTMSLLTFDIQVLKLILLMCIGAFVYFGVLALFFMPKLKHVISEIKDLF